MRRQGVRYSGLAMRGARGVVAVLILLIGLLVLPAVAGADTASTADGLPPAAGAATLNVAVPAFDHIVVVLMENHGFGRVIGNPDASYVNQLAASYTLLDHYYAVAHPSLPNYLALIGGDTYGITTDCERCFVDAPNLADSLATAGLSGKAYMEDMPAPCFVGSRGRYAQKHDPFVYFNDVRNDPGRCASIVPFSQFTTDVAGGQLPAFAWVSPNLCNDMHDCSVAAGDAWLRRNLDPLLSSPAFTQQHSLLALTWDEDEGLDNRVPLILAGWSVKRGSVEHASASHYSLLRTIEAAWNLPPLTTNDGSALPVSAFEPS